MRLISDIIVVSLAVMLLIGGCAAPKTASTTSTAGTQYSEDLAVWRPKVQPVNDDTNATDEGVKPRLGTVEPKYAVNKKLDPILDSIDHINLRRNFIDGFTIQVYSGNREDALNAKKQLTTSLPDLESEVFYVQPNFRVKVGKYYSRLDAQKDFVDVKRFFPTAIIVPEKVAIN